ncbi:MAG: MipA/OmpV family protein [Thiomicrorhabdus sp.]|nr:MipA/OmpV family protein [Thiomicrorhabdus sp.]
MKNFVLFFCLVSMLNNKVSANELIEPAYGLWGVGIIDRDLNYVNSEKNTTIAPFILGGYGSIFIEANRAGFTFYRDGTFFASAVGQLRTHQFRDSSKTGQFEERKQAIELGLQIGARLPKGFFTRLAVLHDVSGTHESYEFDLQLYRRDSFGPLMLLSAIGVQYQNKGLVNYYYGTPSYRANDALGAELELIATYPVGNWGIFAGTRSYIFDNQVSDSPVANGSAIIQFFSGVGYYF